MPLVPAKCPECGGLVEVDNEKRAGLCQHCRQPFVIEDAIQTFNTYYQTTNNYNTTHNYGDGTVVNVYEDNSKDFIIEAGVLKEYHGESAEVVIPNHVTELAKGCFGNLPITQITIPASVTKISCEALEMLPELISIYVDIENPIFNVENNVLFNKKEQKLLLFPPGMFKEASSYVIPNSTKTFSDIAKKQAYNFVSLIRDNIDYYDLSCNDKNNISLAERLNIPYKITHHHYIDCKCLYCGKYDIIYDKTYQIGDAKICVICISDGSMFISHAYAAYRGAFYYKTAKEKNSYSSFKYEIINDSKMYDFVKKCKKLYISNDFIMNREKTCCSEEAMSDILSLFENIEYLTVSHMMARNLSISGFQHLQEVVSCHIASFENCSNLRKVEISGSSAHIEKATFKDCKSLETITLPADTWKIDYGAFRFCNNLKEINIDFTHGYTLGTYANTNTVYDTTGPNINKINILGLTHFDSQEINELQRFFHWAQLGGRLKHDHENAIIELRGAPQNFSWKVFGKCPYCGGEIKVRMFKKNICENCGKEQEK